MRPLSFFIYITYILTTSLAICIQKDAENVLCRFILDLELEHDGSDIVAVRISSDSIQLNIKKIEKKALKGKGNYFIALPNQIKIYCLFKKETIENLGKATDSKISFSFDSQNATLFDVKVPLEEINFKVRRVVHLDGFYHINQLSKIDDKSQYEILQNDLDIYYNEVTKDLFFELFDINIMRKDGAKLTDYITHTSFIEIIDEIINLYMKNKKITMDISTKYLICCICCIYQYTNGCNLDSSIFLHFMREEKMKTTEPFSVTALKDSLFCVCQDADEVCVNWILIQIINHQRAIFPFLKFLFFDIDIKLVSALIVKKIDPTCQFVPSAKTIIDKLNKIRTKLATFLKNEEFKLDDILESMCEHLKLTSTDNHSLVFECHVDKKCGVCYLLQFKKDSILIPELTINIAKDLTRVFGYFDLISNALRKFITDNDKKTNFESLFEESKKEKQVKPAPKDDYVQELPDDQKRTIIYGPSFIYKACIQIKDFCIGTDENRYNIKSIIFSTPNIRFLPMKVWRWLWGSATTDVIANPDDGSTKAAPKAADKLDDDLGVKKQQVNSQDQTVYTQQSDDGSTSVKPSDGEAHKGSTGDTIELDQSDDNKKADGNSKNTNPSKKDESREHSAKLKQVSPADKNTGAFKKDAKSGSQNTSSPKKDGTTKPTTETTDRDTKQGKDDESQNTSSPKKDGTTKPTTETTDGDSKQGKDDGSQNTSSPKNEDTNSTSADKPNNTKKSNKTKYIIIAVVVVAVVIFIAYLFLA